MALAQAGEDGILYGIERGKVDMPALRGLHMVEAAPIAPDMRHA